ncbi:MAG: hypothetical protein EOP14_02555 [Pseudomonas sp.]|nr:MAG: hypothetical protein EOP14_02555 [Pseudomonas sp.]
MNPTGHDLAVDGRPVPTPELEHLEDAELARLARVWRKTALRGDRESFGIAHTLEVEQRRRLRPIQIARLTPSPPTQGPWWKFWSSNG